MKCRFKKKGGGGEKEKKKKRGGGEQVNEANMCGLNEMDSI